MMLVLNVADKASKTCRERLYENSKRSLVVQERMTMRAESCVCKRTGFRDTTKILTQKEDGLRWEISGSPSEVKEVVIECAFAKLCSALGIGVPIGSPDHPYDLVCYEDCIEFFMEKCTPLKAYPRIHPLKIEKRLKYCVQVMHTFHLIHKDLKLENTLVTEDEVIVLADFGISAHVKETAGQASATFR
jgi:serine/threonine protein kinase